MAQESNKNTLYFWELELILRLNNLRDTGCIGGAFMPTHDELAAWLDVIEAEPEQPLEPVSDQNYLEAFAKEKMKWVQFAQKVARAPTERDLQSGWAFRPR
ncbi:MAG: hypothetical protein DI542_13335 [Acinetobacter johnsonii]|nr:MULTISPECIES: hypothetical protein [Aeromonas]PZQ86721.1 MAG: hypothetical protein DI542_13335 [Acinetobacter johnsonii]HEB5079082.1 hypothetical protein [Aeromonas hydrophila subsp. hydrophila]MCW4617868.1 hypothetical protein [Aeromonas hydrophila]MDH1843246.1 hypothetical protein [Aeromonas caviae]UTI04780.1 hypothetical protein NJR02_22040 [Aeromonas caviae]